MNLPPPVQDVLIDDAITRDRTTARRVALVEVLLQERYLTRQQLICRVEGKLGKGCFGESAWKDTFYRDMLVVKRALHAAGYQLVYSRSTRKPGYFLRSQPTISGDLSSLLQASVAEVNRTQIAIFKNLTFNQRFQLGCSITNLASQVAAQRLRQRNPQLTLAQAHRLAVLKEPKKWMIRS